MHRSKGIASMGSKRRRATSPSSSVSGGDFDEGQTSNSTPVIGRKRRRASNIPTVDPVSGFHSIVPPLQRDNENSGRKKVCLLFYSLTFHFKI